MMSLLTIRCAGIERGDNPVLIITSRFLWMEKTTRYKSLGRIAGDFHQWVKSPNNTMVKDKMSFQLDAWLKLMD
jgi:hypothetical protein